MSTVRTADAAPLFPSCPACRRNPVADPREPCAECLAAFGGMIRPSGREVSAEEFAAELERSEAQVRLAVARQREIARRSA